MVAQATRKILSARLTHCWTVRVHAALNTRNSLTLSRKRELRFFDGTNRQAAAFRMSATLFLINVAMLRRVCFRHEPAS